MKYSMFLVAGLVVLVMAPSISGQTSEPSTSAEPSTSPTQPETAATQSESTATQSESTPTQPETTTMTQPESTTTSEPETAATTSEPETTSTTPETAATMSEPETTSTTPETAATMSEPETTSTTPETTSTAQAVTSTAVTEATSTAQPEATSTAVAETTTTAPVTTTAEPVTTTAMPETTPAPCTANPCGPNMICTNVGSSYSCNCSSGFTPNSLAAGCTLNALSQSLISSEMTFLAFNSSGYAAVFQAGSSQNLAAISQISTQLQSALVSVPSFVPGSVVVQTLTSGSLISSFTSVHNVGYQQTSNLAGLISNSVAQYYVQQSASGCSIAGQQYNCAAVSVTSQALDPCASGALVCPSGTVCSTAQAMCVCPSGFTAIGVQSNFSYVQICQAPAPANMLALYIALPIAAGVLIIACVLIIVLIDRNKYSSKTGGQVYSNGDAEVIIGSPNENSLPSPPMQHSSQQSHLPEKHAVNETSERL